MRRPEGTLVSDRGDVSRCVISISAAAVTTKVPISELNLRGPSFYYSCGQKKKKKIQKSKGTLVLWFVGMSRWHCGGTRSQERQSWPRACRRMILHGCVYSLDSRSTKMSKCWRIIERQLTKQWMLNLAKLFYNELDLSNGFVLGRTESLTPLLVQA